MPRRKYPRPKLDGYVGIKEVCELLGVVRQTLWRYRNDDPTFPVGEMHYGELIFKRDEILRWRDRLSQ